jgi:hypothetical protein
MARQAFVFSARLDGWKGVRRTIAVRSDQTLAVLHDALRVAFGWDDDHLYAFWLSGKFWARDGTEYVHPFALEDNPFAGWDLPMETPSRESAEQRLDRLGLTKGQRIAYVFDFGDEWRVRLTLRGIAADDGGAYPRILESVGDAPPQYPDYEEDAA